MYDREQLKAVASKLNFQFNHLLGDDKLEAKLIAHCQELGTTIDAVLADESPVVNAVDSISEKDDLTPTEKVNDSQNSLVERLKKLTFAGTESKASKKASAARNKEALKLVRCIITSHHRDKAQYKGEIITARNAVLPAVTKFVSYGVITHVPQIILNVLKEKKYQMFRTRKDNRGNEVKESYMIPEYNIQILEPISAREFNEIKQRQLADGFNGE